MPSAQSGAHDFDVTFREDGTATVVGRLVSPDGSGAATGRKGEGKWVQQADIASISYRVFDESDSDTEITAGTQSLTVASVVFDTPRTPTGSGSANSDALWDLDAIGYNFVATLPASCFPTGGHTYRAEIKLTFSGGAVGWAVIRGEALAVLSS